MQATIRTTVRIRQDLFDLSKLLALKKGVSLQEVINEGLAIGYKYITDLTSSEQSMRKIDAFRKKIAGSNIDVNQLVEISKSEQK